MKRTLSFLMALAMLCSFGAASAAGDEPSPWAENAVRSAVSHGYVPTELQGDYQKPITRAEFCDVAVAFVAYQQETTVEALTSALPDEPLPFSDMEGRRLPAYALGIIQGRDDGTFGPDAPISRQEAAVILWNTYAAYAGDPAMPEAPLDFTDGVADWAAPQVAIMSAWDIMNGVGDGRFEPQGAYTREQCFVTFYRMGIRAPISRSNQNVAPPLTQEEMIASLLNGIESPEGWSTPSLGVSQRYDTDACTVLYGAYGVPHGGVYLFLVYPDGGCLEILNRGQIPYANLWGVISSLEDLTLSDDETQLTFTVTYPERETHYETGEVIHEPGIYRCAVDLRSGKLTVTATPLDG